MHRLNIKTHGDTKNPTLFMVHGFLSCNAQWDLNVTALSASYHLVSAELWGHGKSPTPDQQCEYQIDIYLQEFEAIRQHLGIEQWGLIGQSYAAGLMLHYSLQHPDHITGLALTNSRSAFGDIVTARAEKNKKRAEKTASTEQNTPYTSSKQNLDLTSTNRHLPVHPYYARRLPTEVKAQLVQSADNMSPVGIELGGLLSRELNSEHLLDKIRAPILIANGIYEKGFQADVKRIKQNHPQITVIDMDGGHAVNIEAARQFNQHVLNFFQHHFPTRHSPR